MTLVIFIMMIFLFNGGLMNVSRRAFGFDMSERNPATCEAITNLAAKDTCYNVAAVNSKDSFLCEEINNTRQRDICFSGLANKLQELSLCDKIIDSFIKNKCADNIK